MADSRLTDLPNLTNPSDDDVLYIVDVTRDSSNKITYSNLVTNTIDSLSAYLTDLKLPDINQIITNVNTISGNQDDFALQTGLNSTNTNLVNLQGTVATYGGFIDNNITDITALSSYIDGKGSSDKVNNNQTNIDTVSASNMLKASQSDLNNNTTAIATKANQTDLNTVSASNLNIDVQLANITTNVSDNSQDIISLSGDAVTQFELNTSVVQLSSTTDRLSAVVEDFIGDAIDTQFEIRPFNVSLTSQSHLLTTFYDINEIDPVEIPLTSTSITANLSSYALDSLGWKGLITNIYPISAGAAQVSVFNPTLNTVSFTDTQIVMMILG
tara:strand:- start:47385 stop:48368 length:984 start_codon:yes stop_codon:yes gene_type:complete